MKYFHFKLLLVSLIFVTCNCKDDDMNPCEVEGLMPVNANFQTYDNLDWQDSTRLIKGDTFIHKHFVTFIAEQEEATYQWKIGTDPTVFEEKQFTLFFQNLEGPVEIQLIVEATPNTDCFPDDDGRDTLTKTIYFVRPEEGLLFGIFRGVLSSAPNDTFNIDVQIIPPFYDETNIDNLPKGCIRDDITQLRFRFSYRHFYMPGIGNYIECPKPLGGGELSDSGIIRIEYTIWDTNTQQHVPDSFIGKKIN